MHAWATPVQAAYRGKLGRRRAFQEVLLPAILARGLEQKRQIERSRCEPGTLGVGHTYASNKGGTGSWPGPRLHG